MTLTLVSCEACERHVFATELHCPFCRAPITRTAPAIPAIAPGLSRAQRLGLRAQRAQSLALAAAVAGQAMLACTDNRQPDPPMGGRGGSAGSGASGGAGEGPLAGEGGSDLAGRPARSGEPSVMPLYGAPVPADAGPRADSSALAGSGSSGTMAASPGSNPVPVYGASPPAK